MKKERRALVQYHTDPLEYTGKDLYFDISDRYEKVSQELKEVVMRSHFLCSYYAEQCNADYYFIDKGRYLGREPSCEKLYLLEDEWTSKYDKILFLDHDMYPWKNIPDIFDLSPSDTLTVSSFKNYMKKHKIFGNHKEDNDGMINYRNMMVKKKDIVNNVWNGGLYVITPTAGNLMSKEMPRIFDESAKHKNFTSDDHMTPVAAARSGTKVHFIEDEWNHSETTDCYITHCKSIRSGKKPGSAARSKVFGKIDRENTRNTFVHHGFNEKADEQIKEIRESGIDYKFPYPSFW